MTPVVYHFTLLVLILGFSVCGRLLSNGACEGGTPETFFRRKQAGKAERREKARALMAAVRARNAAVISSSRKGEGSSAGDKGNGALQLPSSITATNGDDGQAVTEGSQERKVGAGASAGAGAASNAKHRDEESAAAPAVNKPDGDRDEDVRRYEQGFRGLSSAYGAYSSVFGSQVDPLGITYTEY